MDNKEIIIQATIDLINEKGERMNEITVRDICKKANVGLGLVNYHFGNKDKLIDLCVEKMISEIISKLHLIQVNEELSPFEKLEYLGNLTLTFLFEHAAVSRTSIISDVINPKEDDNTHQTYEAYLRLVAECRKDWDQEMVERKTFCLISLMQQVFLRHKMIQKTMGINLEDAREREKFHRKLLHDILEV